MKKVVLLLTFVLCLCNSVYAANVNVQLNGKNVDFTDENGNKVEAQTINSRTMVPMRKIFELLGAEIDWNADTRTVTATKENTKIKLQINNKAAEIIKDGKVENVVLDSAPLIVNNRTLVPLRFVSESLDKQVGWDDLNKTAIIIDYDYFLEKVKNSTPTFYKALTNMPTQSSTMQIIKKYTDLSNSNNSAIEMIDATVTQVAENIQDILIDFDGNSLLFKEIKGEGWGTILLRVSYDENAISYQTDNVVLAKMLDSNKKTYNELELDGSYNLSIPELIKSELKLRDEDLNINSFKNIRDEFDNFLKLFSFSEANGIATIKASGLNFDNANFKYIDYTKFDNVIVENEFLQVYNLINKLIFNYDVKLDELLYDFSNIDFSIVSQEDDGMLYTVITIDLKNDYNEMYSYVIRVNKI